MMLQPPPCMQMTGHLQQLHSIPNEPRLASICITLHGSSNRYTTLAGGEQTA
jgi:hypothetical protein